MDIRPGLGVADEALAGFCWRHKIKRLALFGSVLRADFRDDSDVDVLVEFHSGVEPGLLRLAQMELEFEELLGGREAELRTYEDLSPYLRDTVRAEAVTLYDAAGAHQPSRPARPPGD